MNLAAALECNGVAAVRIEVRLAGAAPVCPPAAAAQHTSLMAPGHQPWSPMKRNISLRYLFCNIANGIALATAAGLIIVKAVYIKNLPHHHPQY